MGVQSKVGPQWLPLPNTQPVEGTLNAYPALMRQDALDAIDILYDEIVEQYRYAAPGNFWAGSRWIGSFLISFGVGHELFDILKIVYDQPGDEDPGFFAVLRELQLTRHAMPSRESGPRCRLDGDFEAFAEIFLNKNQADPIIASSLFVNHLVGLHKLDDLDIHFSRIIRHCGKNKEINNPIFIWSDGDWSAASDVNYHDDYIYDNNDGLSRFDILILDALQSGHPLHELEGMLHGRAALKLLSALTSNGCKLSLIEQAMIGGVLASDVPAFRKFAFLAAMLGRSLSSAAANQSERFGARP